MGVLRMRCRGARTAPKLDALHLTLGQRAHPPGNLRGSLGQGLNLVQQRPPCIGAWGTGVWARRRLGLA